MMFDKDAISVDVGGRLRALRQERNLSMRTLATMSGISANALSMIERGRTSPSVSTLYKLANALGVSITAFFEATLEKQDVVFRKAMERVRVPFLRGLWEGLGGELFTGRVEPFMLTLESGASSGPFSMSHSVHEFVLCLRGQLEYLVENQHFLLEAGDSLIFAAQLQHRWRNPGTTVTNAVFVLSDFQENEDPAAMHMHGSRRSQEGKQGERQAETPA